MRLLFRRGLFVALFSVSALAAAPRVLSMKVVGKAFPTAKDDLNRYFDGCSDCIGTYTAIASNELNSKEANDYASIQLIDNNLQSCWAVGGGPGEWFELLPPPRSGGAPIHGFTLVNGYSKSPDLWRKNSRIKTLRLTIDGKFYGEFNLQDTPFVQSVSFPDPEPRVGEKPLRFEIVDVYPGSTFDDLCVSEIQIDAGH